MKYRNVLGNKFRGQIGKAMVASSWKGRDYWKEYVVPRDPKTELQEQHRGFWSAAGPAWRALRPSQQAFYKGLAVDVTGYNLFLQRHVRALREGTTPEVPVVLAWRTADGRPVRAGWLVVRKDGRELFVESLERGAGEIALTAENAPYALAIRKGGLEDAGGGFDGNPGVGRRGDAGERFPVRDGGVESVLKGDIAVLRGNRGRSLNRRTPHHLALAVK